MRILLLTNEWGGHPGGLRRYLAQLAAALQERGHHCAIAYATHLGANAISHAANVPEYGIPGLDLYSGRKPTPTLDMLDRVIQAESPDLIFFHAIRNAAVIRRLALTHPVVGMMHAYEAICLRDTRRFYFKKKICPHALGWHCLINCHFLRKPARGGRLPRFASLGAAQDFLQACRAHTHLIVPSQYMVDAFVHNDFPPEKIFKLRHFTALPPGDVEATYPRAKRILFVGRLTDRYKGIECVLEALKKTTMDVHLTVAGAGSHLDRAKAVTFRLGLADRVHFLGWIVPGEVGPLYQNALAVVVPSVWAEPFGLVGIEAMAHGAPVIAFGVGGIREWIRDGVNGYEIPWLDTGRMAAAIDALAAHPDRVKQFGMAGRKMVAEEFSESIYMDRLLALFAQVISAGVQH